MTKKEMYLEDLNSLTCELMQQIEDRFKRFDIEIKTEDMDKFCDAVDDIFWKYTNETYQNHN